MRAPIAFCLLIASASLAQAATLTPQEAASHIGEKATVVGTASVYVSKGGTIFVDLGGSGLDAPFTGVIFKDNAAQFPGITAFSGHEVRIIGQIREYRGKPEIILNNAGQIGPK